MGKLRSGNLRNLVLVIASVVLTLAAAEAALRVLDLPRQPMKPNKIKDPVLVYRIPADWPGVDKDGFRNRSVPSQSDIVTLGDSHTYGLNADIDSNWPGQLARLTGLSVYNLGVGGYGPLQYYYLFDRALRLKPKYIIVGLYLPNDIKGVCHPYQQTEYWKMRALQDGLDLSYCLKAVFPDEERGDIKRPGMLQTVGSTIVNSKLGVLTSVTARRLRAYLPKDEEKNIVVSDDKNKTIMSKARLRVLQASMDIKQPEISSSLEVTKTLLSKMATRSRLQGVNLIIMVIPSKEYIFHSYLSDSRKGMPEIFVKMASDEGKLRNAVLGWLASQHIPYVDIAPALLEAVRSQGKIYPHDNDGHPLPAGYAIYAQTLQKDIWKPPTP